MDNREFVELIKKEAVDEVLKIIVKRLHSPRPCIEPRDGDNSIGQSMTNFANQGALREQRQSKWFQQLPDEDKGIFLEILGDSAEFSCGSFFTVIDGVGGDFPGVFEIVAKSGEDDTEVINPENTNMLHDLFSEICEEHRSMER